MMKIKNKNKIELLRFFKAFKRKGGDGRYLLKGSLTLEAALVLPIFIFMVAGMISILVLVDTQMNIQAGMEETARILTRQVYLNKRTGSEGLAVNPITIGSYVKSRKSVDNAALNRIEGGKGGINTLLSTYDEESGMIDIVAAYRFKAPVLPDHISDIQMAQRARTRAWIGRKLDTDGSDAAGAAGEGGEEKDNKTVYVTETGTVYHTSKECSYLDLSIRIAGYDELEDIRNKGGAIYHRCPLCAKKAGEPGQVYITDYGENWHASLDCSGLKRTITEKDIADTDLPMCSKCGQKH